MLKAHQNLQRNRGQKHLGAFTVCRCYTWIISQSISESWRGGDYWPILQMKKVRLREIQWVDHTVSGRTGGTQYIGLHRPHSFSSITQMTSANGACRECVFLTTHTNYIKDWIVINPFPASAAHMVPVKKLVSKRSNKKRRSNFLNSPWCHPPCRIWNCECCSLIQERIKVNGNTWNLSEGVVTIERSKNKITVTSELTLSKRYLKYLTKNFLKNNWHDWLNSQESYELCYLQINQDEEEEDED